MSNISSYPLGLSIPALWIAFEQRQIVSTTWILFAYFESLVLLPFIAAFHPSVLRTLASTVLFATITWTALRFRFDAPLTEASLLFSLHSTMLCNWVDRVILQHPDKQRWHELSQESEGEGLGDQALVPHSYLARLKWSFKSTIAVRGFGWSFQVKNVPQAPCIGTNRW